ncbi:Response regulator protein TmoT [Pandoraea captiosa]|jgi:DNA-binding response OmpR family regulator|uniref:Response regulator protein TmoT n=1 Tax=Pandoraea captiosa TaxID=2508302 RepID=A0A5E4ZVW4_9BURK|nr:response regulator [Pandoraea captiosa]VVE65444.1 Response regulator protein TmoT [Pandoraea captiosa]
MEAARRPRLSKPLIAILEDDDGLRRAIERLLRVAGYRTCTFASPADADLRASVAMARCLIADVQLPGTSGPAFYASLPLPRPPAIFVTANDTPATRATVRAAGARELLTKPFPGSDLLAAVERATRDAS